MNNKIFIFMFLLSPFPILVDNLFPLKRKAPLSLSTTASTFNEFNNNTSYNNNFDSTSGNNNINSLLLTTTSIELIIIEPMSMIRNTSTYILFILLFPSNLYCNVYE